MSNSEAIDNTTAKLRLTQSSSLLALALLIGSAPAQAADTDWGWLAIGTPAAKAQGWTGKGMVVGVVDTGIDFSHPALSGRAFDYNYGSFVAGNNHSHATHVAGIIGATDINRGMEGVAPDVRFSSMKIFTGAGGSYLGDAAVADAYDGAIGSGVRIFNNSWGSSDSIANFTSREELLAHEPLLVGAFTRAVNADAVLVWSTGNDGRSQPSWQAAAPYYIQELKANWIAVTSVGENGTIASYANACGVAKAWCLAAPGGDFNPGIYSTIPGNDYGYMSGTSMAAPYVTGATAIARQMFPKASGAQLAQIVLQTSRDIGAPGIDDVYGWGLLAVDNIVDTINPRGAALFASAAWGRFTALSAIGNTVLDRISDLRNGRGDVVTAPLAFAGQNGAFSQSGSNPRNAYAADLAAAPQPSPLGFGNVWARGLAGRATLSGSASSPQTTADISGGLLGFDLVNNQNLLLGIAGGGSNTNLTASGISDKAGAQAWHVLGYAAAMYGPAFVNVAGGWNSFDQSYQRRVIPGTAGTVFASTISAAQSSSTDVAYFFQGRGGWTFKTEVGQIEPYVHGATRNQSFGGFSETNASFFSLSVPSASLSEAEYGAGVRWACAPIKTVDQRVAVAPTIDLAYVRFTNDGPIQVETNLLGTSVVGQTAALGADAIRVAAGLSLTSLAGISGSFGYTGTVRDAATAHTVSGGLSIKF